jgi:hypothetical protein
MLGLSCDAGMLGSWGASSAVLVIPRPGVVIRVERK